MAVLLSVLVTLAISAASGQDCESLFTPSNEWDGGIQGDLEFLLVEEIHGWTMDLTFDNQFSQFEVRKL